MVIKNIDIQLSFCNKMFSRSEFNIKTFKDVCVQKAIMNPFSFFIAEEHTQDLKQDTQALYN